MRDRRHGASEEATAHRLHNRLAVLRAERHLSRRDVAARVGVNYQTISYIERGDYNPSLELAFRLSELFGVPIEAVFSRRPLDPLSQIVFAHRRPESSFG